jgi:glycosyltransferase involved in cell wall biosynthesis
VSPGWIDSIVSVFEQQQDVGVVGSKLIYPNGRLQEAGGILWKDGSAWNFGNGEHPDSPAFNYLKEVDYCSGASLAIDRRLFIELGSFDEHYLPAYCEDSDLCMKVRSAGYRVFYQPFSQITHYEGISHGKDLNEGIKAYQVSNQRKLLTRWKKTWDEENYAPGEFVFLARERARNKRLILVVDHYVPQPDKDAGSKTMIQFMGAFQDLGFVVKFWPDNIHYDPDYTPLLQQQGIETYYGEQFIDFESWCRSHLGYFDYILLSRPAIAENKLDILKKHKRHETPIIFYGHDVHHLRQEREYELTGDGNCLVQARIEKERELKIWQKVDLILYPSEEEAVYVADLDGSYKAKAIQPYYFNEFPGQSALTRSGRNGILFVAGFGHPPNADAATWLIEEIMPLVWKVLKDVRVFLVGSNPTRSVRSLASARVEVTGYVSEEKLQEFYRRSLVAVVPLTYGAGIKSKVVESIAFGIPLVTTPVGAQGLPGLDQISAVTEETEEFSRRIVKFYQDEDAWLRSSHAGVDYARQRFSRNAMADQWNDILAETGRKTRLQHAG